jgi:hypothetical protein
MDYGMAIEAMQFLEKKGARPSVGTRRCDTRIPVSP